ncbi:MAG TPA: M23 family metallopeptidase, partial [Patescibacteria group bacterium]|nr:M23 family metallopeptidase [Patescibacteria group bacterium]
IFHPSSAPLNITHLFKKNTQQNIGIRLLNWCSTKKTISPLYIVNINIKDIPDPIPFIDLPWDYKGKNMSFTDAALSMASYFDHEYPLLSSGLEESDEVKNSVLGYDGNKPSRREYSSHDGYDYSSIANVHIDEPILSASAGYASYINTCSACGNMIIIDHQNGYQTRYMHMQKDGLITSIPNEKI